ncbi:hypothetical protein PSYMO_21828 [Pseudomonas amygdali pv. mori str. 301020]|uniref:Uncharacterized protein n=1 Tax=Pseudomonas amygdali pv. mori str. 301020 TaxID=629261 RepID=A0A656GEP2_PSEA0|nr:hypothetical protein PSYMO_21828 [Pseudomonas amygdali pv. mori str. 301020]RMS34213.1 hypothetical protein ALP67_200024 [Pseudomonas ficuserectae]
MLGGITGATLLTRGLLPLVSQLWQVPETFPCLNGRFLDLSGWVVDMWIRFRFYFGARGDGWVVGDSRNGRLITDAIRDIRPDGDHSGIGHS